MLRPIRRSVVSLFCCAAVFFGFGGALAWAQQRIALTGTLITPDGIVASGAVVVEGGRIVSVGPQTSLKAGTRRIETHGIILPGLIDLHNHLTWNLFPRWKPAQTFGSRYDWQQLPAYNLLMDTPHKELVAEGLECQMERYAEVKAMSEGETSVVGGTKANCGERLVHNLDLSPAPASHQVVYNVFPIQMSEEALHDADRVLDAKGALLIHLAEGAPNNAAGAREFAMLKGRGLLRPGVSLIHGVALTADDFAEMSANGVGLIWSPRSNIELYGDTARVAAAKAAQVKMAIAPDWSPTGSDGSLAELNYAAAWNASQAHPVFTDRELVEMATSNAAAMIGMGGSIGSLKDGYAADLLVLHPHRTDQGKDAYWSVVHSDAKDVELLMIGGKIVYGDASLLDDRAEPVAVCNTHKALDAGTDSFASTEGTLDAALEEWGRKLAPLAECGQ